ncbi:hypothetical protein HPB50_028948 [Hyalomma asiaticum]|nr:hypothetical protein HPB50_028948 [Hyalomma asiaticum]
MLSLLKLLDDCERVSPQAYATGRPSPAARRAPGPTLPHPPFRAALWQNITQQQTGYTAPYARMEQPGYRYTDPPLEAMECILKRTQQ